MVVDCVVDSVVISDDSVVIVLRDNLIQFWKEKKSFFFTEFAGI